MDRYTRQRRLTEVGDTGQRRLEAARVHVRGNEGALVETAYLARAGVSAVSLTPLAPPEPFAHGGAFRFGATRAVASGAWRALAKIRRALEMDPP